MIKSIKRVLAILPSKLPQGVTEFKTWSDDILDIYNMPNNDSTKFALAVAIMHLPATAAYTPKAYFGKILVKGAATQVANAMMHELKENQQKLAAEEAKKAAETPVEDTMQAQDAVDVAVVS